MPEKRKSTRLKSSTKKSVTKTRRSRALPKRNQRGGQPNPTDPVWKHVTTETYTKNGVMGNLQLPTGWFTGKDKDGRVYFYPSGSQEQESQRKYDMPDESVWTPSDAADGTAAAAIPPQVTSPQATPTAAAPAATPELTKLISPVGQNVQSTAKRSPCEQYPIWRLQDNYLWVEPNIS